MNRRRQRANRVNRLAPNWGTETDCALIAAFDEGYSEIWRLKLRLSKREARRRKRIG